MSYRFLTKRGIIALHQQQISEHGGTSGLRDEGLLESTLTKAQNLLAYVPSSNIWDLAAAYGYGFIQNHVFIDGNKRVGLAAMAAFLYLNGYEMTSTEAEEVSVVIEVATGNCTQSALADWIQHSIVRL
ncbi:MAG: type II toxin-antitoxin system death-on-curing family toxin [Phormidesmis sp. RL_2_1]|nr:type II toxin-antitoxin system death-on-curing family toxin [Phormidesmis sp. RL_2_1]